MGARCELSLTNLGCFLLCDILLITEDLGADRVPDNFKDLLEEKFRNYGDSEAHRLAYVYFDTRILPAVNSSSTRFDKNKYNEKLSECFSYTDKGFALMMVHNYEPRWRSQHVALVEYPLETRKSRENRWENAKYTSSTEGSRRGNSWEWSNSIACVRW